MGGEMSCLQKPVARSPTTAVSTSPDKAARSSRERREVGRGGGAPTAENGGKRPTFQADAWILGRPSQTVNTFLNKSFLLPSGRIFVVPVSGNYPFALRALSFGPRERASSAGVGGRERGKVRKLRPRTGPRSPHPRTPSRFAHISMNPSPSKRVISRRYFYSIFRGRTKIRIYVCWIKMTLE